MPPGPQDDTSDNLGEHHVSGQVGAVAIREYPMERGVRNVEKGEVGGKGQEHVLRVRVPGALCWI